MPNPLQGVGSSSLARKTHNTHCRCSKNFGATEGDNMVPYNDVEPPPLKHTQWNDGTTPRQGGWGGGGEARHAHIPAAHGRPWSHRARHNNTRQNDTPRKARTARRHVYREGGVGVFFRRAVSSCCLPASKRARARRRARSCGERDARAAAGREAETIICARWKGRTKTVASDKATFDWPPP